MGIAHEAGMVRALTGEGRAMLQTTALDVVEESIVRA